MELRYLRYFVAVAEELSFSKAALLLNISQPPLSQQILRLEEEVGAPLFARTKRSVRLTPAGEAFLQKARLALEQVEGAVEAARLADQGIIGALRIGFVPSASLGFLPRAVNAYSRAYPKVDITLLDLMTGEQVQRFAEGALDVGFARPPIEGKGFKTMPVVRDPFVAVIPARHRLARRRSLAIEDLRGERFFMVPHSLAPGLYSQTLELCSAAGFYPEIDQEIGQIDIIVNFIAEGLGVALMPRSVRLLHREGVAYRELPRSETLAEIDAVWRDGPRSAILDRFLETVRASATPFLSA